MVAIDYQRLLSLPLLEVLRELLLTLAPHVDTLDVFNLLSWLIFILPNLESLVESYNNVSARALEESAFGIGNTFLVTKDTVVVLLPHINVRSLDLGLNCLFDRCFWI